jgi:hypothetical protein
MASINTFTEDEVSGIGIGPEHGVTMARLNELITKVNGMDTPTEIPYTPAQTTDWPGTDPDDVQGALDTLAARVTVNTAAIAAIVDDHVRAACVGLEAKTDEIEVSAALSGSAAKVFTPAEVVIVVTAKTGTVAGNGTINVGTSTGGAQILSAQALTGLDAVGKARRIPLSEAQTAIVGNATMYANVEVNDTTATSLVLSVFVLGRQF